MYSRREFGRLALVGLPMTVAFAQGSSKINSSVNGVRIGVQSYSFRTLPLDDAVKAMQVALTLGMDRRFVLHTPLMWIDKAETFALAQAIGGNRLVESVVELTHSCYLGDRSRRHDWGYGCGECPACQLRAAGFAKWQRESKRL